MTPEEAQILREEVRQLRGAVNSFMRQGHFYFTKNMELPKEIGVKIATDSKQKMSFWGATPIVRPATISDPSGQAVDLDSEARSAINTIIDRLQAIGLIA